MTFHLPSSGPQSPVSGIVAFLPPPTDRKAAHAFRAAVAAHIDRMIAMLDEIDGDADLEPHLAGPPNVGAACDAEGDFSDFEPSLGSLGGTAPYYGHHSREARQTNWAGGSRTDLEGRADEDDEDGGDDELTGDEEPSLGFPDRMVNQEHLAHQGGWGLGGSDREKDDCDREANGDERDFSDDPRSGMDGGIGDHDGLAEQCGYAH